MTLLTGPGSLDRSSGMPLYRQIKKIIGDELREADEAQQLTEQELTRRFRVSRSTVRQALQELANDGLVYRDRAKGTFPVRRVGIERPASLSVGGLIGYLADQGLEPSSVVTDVARAVPSEPVAAALQLSPGETVLSFARRIFAKGDPLSIAHIHLRSPEEFLPSAADLESAGSAIALLEARYGTTVSRSEHHVWARGAGAEEAAALGLEVGAPVLEVESLTFTREGRPLIWRRIVDRGEGVKHVFISGAPSA